MDPYYQHMMSSNIFVFQSCALPCLSRASHGSLSHSPTRSMFFFKSSIVIENYCNETEILGTCSCTSSRVRDPTTLDPYPVPRSRHTSLHDCQLLQQRLQQLHIMPRHGMTPTIKLPTVQQRCIDTGAAR